MEADPANEAMIKPDPGASSSSRGVSPPKKAETRKEQTPQPSPIKKKSKTETFEVKNEPESRHEPKGKPGRPQSVPKRTAEAPPESAAPRPRGRPRKMREDLNQLTSA